MRPVPARVALLVLPALVVLSAAAPGVVAATTASGPDATASVAGSGTATLDGRVTGEDGAPVGGAYVVVQNASGAVFADLALDRAVQDGFYKLARADPRGVAVARTGADGRYRLSLPPGEYDAVAVTRERLSRLRTTRANATLDLTSTPTGYSASRPTPPRSHPAPGRG